MSDLCFITTCRGRLANLKQSLPTFVAQPNTSCIVVDYDCPQHTGAWVRKNFPQVRVVHVTDCPRFELSRARNLGAEAADAPWLCFIDADVQLAANFAAAVTPLLQPRSFYQPDPRPMELMGTCIVHRDDFRRIEGYDDVLQGWGAEDGDFYARLKLIGTRLRNFPGDLLTPLPHDPAARVQFYEEKNQWLNCAANRVYCRAKFDLMLIKQGNLPHQMRATLYNKLYSATLEAHADGQPLEIGIPLYEMDTKGCGPLEARLFYRLPHPRGNPPPTGDNGPASNDDLI
jgi:glycosyltransferase involved in cell wall biosynthesis